MKQSAAAPIQYLENIRDGHRISAKRLQCFGYVLVAFGILLPVASLVVLYCYITIFGFDNLSVPLIAAITAAATAGAVVPSPKVFSEARKRDGECETLTFRIFYLETLDHDAPAEDAPSEEKAVFRNDILRVFDPSAPDGKVQLKMAPGAAQS